jgi:hypothetical protein
MAPPGVRILKYIDFDLCTTELKLANRSRKHWA